MDPFEEVLSYLYSDMIITSTKMERLRKDPEMEELIYDEETPLIYKSFRECFEGDKSKEYNQLLSHMNDLNKCEELINYYKTL